jgi:serine/threonine protein kinase
MTSPVPEVAPGTVIAGKYRVERTLGAGGMGYVVAATHLELEQLVAVKFLHADSLGNADAVLRFMREAQAAAKIKSEHVARVLDVGRLEQGEPYMVLEYLEGQDLGAVVQNGALSIENAVDYLAQACHAIAEAHDAGIVHRDLKPSNLFLVRNHDGTGTVKVLDFGISKLSNAGETDAKLTKTATMMGSPLYMSPEQMKSARDVDPRTDIWSLGVILYELLGGRPPFNGESLPELVTAVVIETPPTLAQVRPEVPPGLDALVMRCLEKDPARRFQSVAELARELLPFAPRRSQLIIERTSRRTDPGPEANPAGKNAGEARGAAAVSAVAGTAAPWTRTSSSPSSSKKALWLAVPAVALVGLGIAAAQLMPKDEKAAVEPPPSATEAVLPPSAPAATPVLTPVELGPTVEPKAEPLPPPSASVAPPPALVAVPAPKPRVGLAAALPQSPKAKPAPAPAPAPKPAPAATTARPQSPARTLDIPLK